MTTDETNACPDCGATFSSPGSLVTHQVSGTCRYTLRSARSHTALLASPADVPREPEAAK